ncbi:hypothetical protein BGW38_010019 [Lunasporangiospora selenospora]|uniref:ubiquitinyl hydrolase 1 n=1 Tax=Lunasporangiospora selenospora TaxID=979761 RepID=A0A9P6KFP6_9FUNG|nr:hypothetical protein BGW38_010019 [Lunasporangiospora selenospora]
MAPFGHKFDKRWRFLGPGGVLDVNNLTEAHLRAVYGLEHCPSKENDQNSPGGVWGESARPENQNRLYPYCNNRYAPQETSPILTGSSHASNKACTLAKCKEGNPHCLNYFGQAQWESEDAFETYYGARFKEASEELVKRPREIPAGMKVWFHDMVFRKCIYQCQFASEAGKNMLQQVFLYLDLGSRTVYNPLALVKSLNLDTSMQQDAQEFCNLFLAKIDSQLQLQEDPFLRDFVKNQFQGRYSYHTTCGHCKKLSTRECTFYELMLNIRDNNTLMDSLEDFIEPEELKGADQYFCSACASLQDASRAIKFEALPEVLNIQLMRFVYDSSTWTKKKSKDVLRFPETIDLGELLEPKQSVLYDLSAVLVHSGPSAYSGHFVAYVMDPKSKKWFMLNDEDVREFSSANFDPEELIESMGKSDSKKDSSKMASSDSEKLLNMLSSKNAYMLIYSKRKIDAIPQPTPSPGESLRSVLEDNESLEKDLQKIAKEKEEVRSSFNAARDERRHLYRQWEVTDDQQGGCYIARETLEEYMQFPKDPAETGPEDKASQETIIIDNSSITCKHQKLCPLGFSKSKLVNENAMNVFLNSGRFKMETTLTRTDFCEVCTKNVCRDKLYSFFHRKDIEEFERKAKSVRSPGHAWVSRSWLSEWLKVTPLFRLEHGSVQDDPKPTSREFLSDILCPHEMLNADKTRRRLINKSAFSVLEKAFGELSLPGGDSVECTVCLDEKKPKVDNRKDVASRAASEKTELADMLMRGPRIWQMEDGVRYCIVSQVFMKKWTSFVKRPLANDRPDALDNATLLCPHDLFLFDMNNKVDFENQDDICIIKEEEWGHLLAL